MRKVLIAGLLLGASINCWAEFTEGEIRAGNLMLDYADSCYVKAQLALYYAKYKNDGVALNTVLLKTDDEKFKEIARDVYSSNKKLVSESGYSYDYFQSCINYGRKLLEE